MTSDHPIKRRKKLIEDAFPLEAINAASAREKSIRHGHPSMLHLWWARQPLAAARAPHGWHYANASERPNLSRIQLGSRWQSRTASMSIEPCSLAPSRSLTSTHFSPQLTDGGIPALEAGLALQHLLTPAAEHLAVPGR
jgi:hypothetical protein